MKLTCLMRTRNVLYALAGAIMLAPHVTGAQASDYKTVEPNVLTVAITGDMPGLIAQNGRLVGYDGEILQKAAENLGLKINPMPTEWSGAIAAVQAGRVDLIGGTVAWTPERAKALSLTDPTGYFQNGVTQKSSTHWTKLKDLENRKVGSMTGFSFLPELRKIPGIELTLYDTSDAALRDLINGRVEAIIGDPPVIDYAIAQNPSWGLINLAFADNNPDFPLLTSVGRQYIFGLSKDNKPLADALSREIRKLWDSCEVKAIGKKYGFSREAQFTPSKVNFRVGVDRPDGWEPPACKT
ncbi:amino acid ABC transporter substrate-binding protein [Aliirhizobium smilacinae]|uniref:Amino acid ABC transporter substrate-binding protein n=2 Tax=Aliirhizobium smilacinae TaxID=1395944 RepID=A0A5C4XU68_9HYPH|nr:amino acid ABC transporter substrate-binding protein [Rhizobium smilacinae]